MFYKVQMPFWFLTFYIKLFFGPLDHCRVFSLYIQFWSFIMASFLAGLFSSTELVVSHSKKAFSVLENFWFISLIKHFNDKIFCFSVCYIFLEFLLLGYWALRLVLDFFAFHLFVSQEITSSLFFILLCSSFLLPIFFF